MSDTSFIDDLIEDETTANADAANADDKPDEDLKSQVEALTKKEKGFYNEMRAEREKRQQIQTQLDRLTGTLNAMLEQRKQAVNAPAVPPKKFNGIPVAETEEGDLYIPEEHLSPILQQRDERIRQLEMALQRTNASQTAETEAERLKAAIVGENEQYAPAYQKYVAARKWASDQVAAFQRENGISGLMTSGQALDYVFDDRLEAEFAEKFPGVPLDEVITAEDSQRNFRRMLKMVSKALTTEEENPRLAPKGLQNERFKKLLKKPSGLGSTPNAKSGNLSMMEKLDGLSFQDIMALDDRQAKALQEALLLEEKEEGLMFK